jgi:hypothetical protein
LPEATEYFVLRFSLKESSFYSIGFYGSNSGCKFKY